MSVKKGGNNITASHRLYEKDYVLEFHKGFVLTNEQFNEVNGYLNTQDFEALEKFLKKHFESDEFMVHAMIEHQKKLKQDGYYK